MATKKPKQSKPRKRNLRPPKPKFPKHWLDTADYVAQYCRLNCLIGG